MGEQPAGNKLSCAVEVAGVPVLLAEHMGFIFPQQQMTWMQFLMCGGWRGVRAGPLRVTAWSCPSLAVSSCPCWEGEGTVDSDGLR